MDQLPVTIVVSRRPAPGRERDLAEWADGLLGLAERFPGHLAGEVMATHDLEGDLVVAISFENADAVHFWERSEERAAWLARADELLSEPARPEMVTGFESIFAASSSTHAVPRWKPAVVIALAIYPVHGVGRRAVAQPTPRRLAAPRLTSSRAATSVLVAASDSLTACARRRIVAARTFDPQESRCVRRRRSSSRCRGCWTAA